jgi:uncharacterized SAM-binding protein YcdF (DUF218 family)
VASLKLILGAWLLPLPLSALAVCLGLLFLRAGSRRTAFALLVGGALLGFGASFGPVADSLLLPLEERYAPVLDVTTLPMAPRYVVVLGSGYRPRPALPVTAALDASGVVRLAEGVRLYRQLPGVPLIVSGGAPRGNGPIAHGYALAAIALGVPPASIVLLDTPLDTGMEIRAIHERVGDATVLLVTSAAHMPRAMALSGRDGLHAIAAPTGNLVTPSVPGAIRIAGLSGAALIRSETAIHEYLGLLALRFGIF